MKEINIEKSSATPIRSKYKGIWRTEKTANKTLRREKRLHENKKVKEIEMKDTL